MASASRICPVCETHTETVFRVDGMDCPNEVAILERRLKHMPGVHDMRADVLAQRLLVSHDAARLTAGAIAQAVADTGMRAFVEQGASRSTSSDFGLLRTVLLVISGVALAGAALAEWRGGLDAVTIAGSLVAIGLAGPWTARRALASVRNRTLDINVLMVVAVGGALLLRDWLEAGSVTFLFALAQWLEIRSLERARRAIGALFELAPGEALIRRGGSERLLPAQEIAVDDVLVVRPGERIAADGTVATGESDVNQAPVTGESLPVRKAVGDPVFAGSINGHGGLEVHVTRAGRDSTLARVLHLVEDAQSKRAPAQAFVDRFAHVYTPAVLVIAALVAVVPSVFFGQPALDWIYRALVLLVIACPCALVISTPVSVVSALAAAARAGVLVKGGVYLERAAAIRCIAFDKTGTLTSGRLSVDRVVPVNGHDATTILATAAALERRSEHPIGRAIVRHAEHADLSVPAAEGFFSLPGRGAQATVGGRAMILGNHRLLHERSLCTPDVHALLDEMEADGRTTVVLATADEPIGLIAVADQERSESRRALDDLRAAGIASVAMLTGDSRRTADVIAGRLSVNEVHAELLPEDKVRLVSSLRARHGAVAMVGDGVNDAPALAAADLGIAMGAAGSDVALETADVALMGDDLSKLPHLVRLGRATLFNIKTNIAIALGLKAIFLVLAVAGQATLWMAVAADMGASLLVIGNGLRLLHWGTAGGPAGQGR
ncbi:MAG: heavy metal translocating P-type ATPase [Vicinamibacterales bacterium]